MPKTFEMHNRRKFGTFNIQTSCLTAVISVNSIVFTMERACLLNVSSSTYFANVPLPVNGRANKSEQLQQCFKSIS